ncbi:conserved hypothetical protein [Gloeothece citriformis PCC 7424]|uniref:DUF2834 domain-containing protein n=1 Tax=Gloeothece citriformis (strain PCC 7424) TaxID=65393 RepID=B7KGU2_GLOC7|nr:DUF2834 domain-containing protein [Gloeothece citriformis]ACK73429.1 conserved hypothetical protein [Gloeothece citriformis PCC 7424]
MNTKIILWLIWVIFITYTLWLAPLDQPGNLTLVEKLIKLEWADLNAIIPVIFSLMGVWPLIYASFMFIDERTQPISAWPSFVTSNGAGVIGLLPYLILRHPNQDSIKNKTILLKILDSRAYGVILSLTTLGLFIYAILGGDWGDFIRQWQTNHFVHLISLDFCLMCVVFPAVLGDDMARRGLRDDKLFWIVTLIPLLGALAYLCLRPPLPEENATL